MKRSRRKHFETGTDHGVGRDSATAPHAQAAAASTPPAEAARFEYVNAADVAEVCGLSAHALHTRYLPTDWGVPREWRFCGTQTLYRLSALPELADELADAGLVTEAERLRQWWLMRSSQAQLETISTPPALPADSPQPDPVKTPWYQKDQFA